MADSSAGPCPAAKSGASAVTPRYLLDTNVVSELRKPRPNGRVVAWLESLHDHQLAISVVTLGEIQAGIELTRDQDPAKALEIEVWLDQLAATHNLLPMDATTFRSWARLMHRKSNTLLEDALIAATAQVHGLTVATRNIGDFKALGVSAYNPFSSTAG